MVSDKVKNTVVKNEFEEKTEFKVYNPFSWAEFRKDFDYENQPLSKKEVDAIWDTFTSSTEYDDDAYEDLTVAEKKAIKKAKKLKKYLPKYKMTQLGIIDQDLLSKMTYQSYLGIRYVDKKSDELVKKFNRRIVRNYILSAILGGLVVGGVVMVSSAVDKAKNQVIEQTIQYRK